MRGGAARQALEHYPTTLKSDEKLLKRSGVLPQDEGVTGLRKSIEEERHHDNLTSAGGPTVKGRELAALSARWSEKKALTGALYSVQHLRRLLNSDDSKGLKVIIK